MGYSCRTLLWDTLVGHSCRKLLWDTLVGHSCGTLLWDTPVGHTLRTRLPPKVTLRGCKTSVSYETSSKSHASSLKNERFVRDFLQNSHVKSPKRAFRTRLPPKVTCQVPKTSVSYETSSKTLMSKSAKRTFRTRLPPAETPIGAHTSRSPAKQFRESSPSKRHPLTRQSQCDSDIHLYHNSQPPDSLRLPRIFPRPLV